MSELDEGRQELVQSGITSADVDPGQSVDLSRLTVFTPEDEGKMPETGLPAVAGGNLLGLTL